MKTVHYLFLVVFVCVILGSIYVASLHYISTEQIEFVVYQKYIKPGSSDGESNKYMIVTSDEVFTNRDDLFRGKFNSSDVQAQLTPDSTTVYSATATGKRIPILSKYRNLVNIEKVSK